MVPILRAPGADLGGEVGRKSRRARACAGAVLREAGGAAEDEVAEQVAGRLAQDRVGQGPSAGHVAGLEPEHRGVVPGVGIHRIELAVGAQGHRA